MTLPPKSHLTPPAAPQVCPPPSAPAPPVPGPQGHCQPPLGWAGGQGVADLGCGGGVPGEAPGAWRWGGDALGGGTGAMVWGSLVWGVQLGRWMGTGHGSMPLPGAGRCPCPLPAPRTGLGPLPSHPSPSPGTHFGQDPSLPAPPDPSTLPNFFVPSHFPAAKPCWDVKNVIYREFTGPYFAFHCYKRHIYKYIYKYGLFSDWTVVIHFLCFC